MRDSLAAVSLLGVPYDAHSSFLRGPAGAPTAVRAALDGGSANWCTERGIDLDPARVAEAKEAGAEWGMTPSDDHAAWIAAATEGHGADAVYVTAASSSSA